MNRSTLAFSLFLLLPACSSTYTSPRTVPPGQLRHGVLLETNPTRTDDDERRIVAGRYQLRIGVTDRVDLGFQTSGVMLGGDLKWNPIRSVVDVALQGRAEAHLVPRLWEESRTSDRTNGVTVLQPMLLFGVNPVRRASLVVLGGPAWVDWQGAKSTMIKGGLGLSIRATRSFTIQPEFQLVRTILEDRYHVKQCCVVFGMGFAWGATTEYRDIDGDP